MYITLLASVSVTVNEPGMYTTLHECCHNNSSANKQNHDAQTHKQGRSVVYSFISYGQISFCVRMANSKSNISVYCFKLIVVKMHFVVIVQERQNNFALYYAIICLRLCAT